MNDRERDFIRGKHQPSDAIARSLITRCSSDGDPWPCDTVKLLDVADTVAVFADSWYELATDMLADEYGCTLTCGEAEALADMWRVLGDPKTAQSVIDNHAAHDTGEDQHYERGIEVLAAHGEG